jgi:hypothetical protein
MAVERIEVVAYSGYQGEETPRSFIFQGKETKISEILSMWIEEHFEDKTRKRFFQVRGSDGYKHKIYYDEEMKQWFLTKE